jgi:hypothetical protein
VLLLLLWCPGTSVSSQQQFALQAHIASLQSQVLHLSSALGLLVSRLTQTDAQGLSPARHALCRCLSVCLPVRLSVC